MTDPAKLIGLRLDSLPQPFPEGNEAIIQLVHDPIGYLVHIDNR